jgi:hypothetical protein
MGGAIDSGARALVRVDVRAAAGSTLELWDGDALIGSRPLTGAGAETTAVEFKLNLARGVHPLRAQVRAADGRLSLLSNPIMATRR